MNKLAKFALPLLLLSGAVPAMAQDAGRVSVSASVSYADLNLSSAAGQATFDRRIAHAIDEMCGYRPMMGWHDSVNVNQCRRQARLGVTSLREEAIAGNRRGSGSIQVAAATR